VSKPPPKEPLSSPAPESTLLPPSEIHGEVTKDSVPSKLEQVTSRLAEGKAGTFGYVKVGEDGAVLLDELALYYPQYSRLEIGFYVEALSPQQRTQIVETGELLAAKNMRHPSVVVILPVKNPSEPISPTNLQNVTVQFYREFGQFNFSTANR